MVTPGETLTMCSRPSADRTRIHFEIVNAEGRVVVTDGFAKLRAALAVSQEEG